MSDDIYDMFLRLNDILLEILMVIPYLLDVSKGRDELNMFFALV